MARDHSLEDVRVADFVLAGYFILKMAAVTTHQQVTCPSSKLTNMRQASMAPSSIQRDSLKLTSGTREELEDQGTRPACVPPPGPKLRLRGWGAK